MKLWVKWEQLDIQAMLEAIEIKSQMELQRQKRMLRKQNDQKDLERLNNGKKSIKTIFMSHKSAVNKITNLKHKIEDVIIQNIISFHRLRSRLSVSTYTLRY